MRKIERVIETILFQSRWLLAPFYLGLAFACCCSGPFRPRALPLRPQDPDCQAKPTSSSASLRLIDLAFTGNLVLIVIFSGYENFVSKIEIEARRPAGLDDQGRFRRSQAEADDVDRRDLGDPGAQGVHEHRSGRDRRQHQARLAGRHPRAVPRLAAGGCDRRPDCPGSRRRKSPPSKVS